MKYYHKFIGANKAIDSLIENQGVEMAIDFYLDILIECLIMDSNNKYRYEHIYVALKYLSLKIE